MTCPGCQLHVTPGSPNTVRQGRKVWHASCWADLRTVPPPRNVSEPPP